jgi:ParB family chromosome partitioning protein
MRASSEVQMVPVDAITVLSPRARNKRVFHELITSIAHLGLKKPITVSRRETEPGYDLVCGQGRPEAFIALGQSEIPAIDRGVARGLLCDEPSREPGSPPPRLARVDA